MRKVYPRGPLSYFRRSKFCSILFTLSFILLCFVFLIYENGNVVEIPSYESPANQEKYSEQDLSYRKLPTELNALDFFGSRRHNRNLQHLYSKDLFDEKRKKDLTTMIYKKGRNQMKSERKVVSNLQQRGLFNVPKKTIAAKVGDTPSSQEVTDYYNFEGYRTTSSDDSVESEQIGVPCKKLPKVIIIGVKKCGTRALLEFLRIHPEVKATGPEPHFFDRYYDHGLEWYRDLMPETNDEQTTIEKTPRYFVTKEVPKRVFNMSRDVKLVLIVRDPVTRAISDYTQVASKRASMKPFEQMALSNNHTGLVDTSWPVIKIGIYAKHLEEWLRYFPLEQFHFVNGENIVKNPSEEMFKLQDFLGLRRYINDSHFYMNDTRGFPCIQKTGSKYPHCLVGTKGRKHPYVDPNVIKRLQDFYRPFNKKFYQMTNIDFGWP
ncbi:heparan sulfate glucosamine 3-O-sulfotransferase 6-like [Mizuhopecten yessoensis]|uniref:Heparan sulfate glucosamine 3-O-sulfotransferase 3A1 n=1 Tax=Mizuhopecten yessoensis TaxID=6573 RepID=A0A210PFK2_MIZYE|nr:heparan sulfate glucosamine 3-O-sulfotransferase 6-like [Mizuhopecten yessoensis]OWF35226.1 Heparan sulfate glucosamine 3-O-sulfotransferase 3A1 [Mizuhopecten yessoensis]